MTKISIIIPVFTGHENLKYLLPAINQQTLRPCEIVIVDSCSHTEVGGLGTVTQPYIESTTYTALRDISLNYTLPSSVSDRLGLNYLQVGFSGRNLWLDTDYTGLSPEVSQFGNEAVGGSVDTNPFPLSKSMYFTLSLGL